MSNQSIYDSFRKAYPEFVYERYVYDVQSDGLHIVFTFRIGRYLFTPDAFFPTRPFLHFDFQPHALDTLVFNIGMIELVSYWKAFCPPQVTIACGTLDDEQKAFWKKVYYNGLGEFFYRNGIVTTMDDFMEIVCSDESIKPSITQAINHSNNQAIYLVPIGGGKDSVVTLELLRDLTGQKGAIVPLIMNPRGATLGCIKAAGYKEEDALIVQRSIDPLLLRLNSEGCLNGHTPFSAMLACYSLLASRLSGIRNIALSNEWSANESTVAGTSVNHQYSKGLEFENDFRRYAARFIDPDCNYFSFLRPLSELQIAMLFSRHEKYFDVFRSCNAGSKQDVWCGQCAKCLFAYIILSPFIPPDRLRSIFGKDMLDDPRMKQFFDELTGRGETKPFECVGTVDEVNAALGLAVDRWYPGHRPCLLADFNPPASRIPLTSLHTEHNLSNIEFNNLLSHVQAAAVQ